MISVVARLACAIALAALHPAALPAQDAPRPLLEIDLVAVDREGKPLADLKPDDLEVWIGGYRVPIESLLVRTPDSADAEGRLVVLLLDDMTLDPSIVARGRDVATAFVDRMLPGDRMAIVTLNGGGMPLTSEQSRLRAPISAWKQSLGVMPVDQVGAHLLRVVDSIGKSLVEAPGKRKTIVAIGSGWLLDTPVPPPQIGRDIRREWYAAIRSLALADASYYVIDPRGVGASRQLAAQGLARETGGHAFVNTNDLEGAAERILDEASHFYVVRVGDPPVGRKQDLRDLDVRSKRRDVTIRVRRALPGGA